MICVLADPHEKNEGVIYAHICDNHQICGNKLHRPLVLVLEKRGRWQKVLFPDDMIIMNEGDGYIEAWRIALDLATSAGLLDNPLVKQFIGDWGALV